MDDLLLVLNPRFQALNFQTHSTFWVKTILKNLKIHEKQTVLLVNIFQLVNMIFINLFDMFDKLRCELLPPWI